MASGCRDNPRLWTAGVASALLALLFAIPSVAHGQYRITEEGPIFGGETKRPLFTFDGW